MTIRVLPRATCSYYDAATGQHANLVEDVVSELPASVAEELVITYGRGLYVSAADLPKNAPRLAVATDAQIKAAAHRLKVRASIAARA